MSEEQERKKALAALKKRQSANKKITRKRNEDLYAGSPMYYYCHNCGEEIILPETHSEPAPEYCSQCKKLKQIEWI